MANARSIPSTLKRSFERFSKDHCSLHASALTYYTLLSIVPMLALAFGIAKGFDLDNVIETQVKALFSQYEIVADKAIEFAKNMLENSKGGVIAGTGVLFLIYTIVNLLHSIENSLNNIWHVEKGRSWRQKITEYTSIAWLAPFFLIIFNAASVYLFSQIVKYSEQLPFIGEYARDFLPLIKLVPYLLTTLLLTFLYAFMPNCSVPLRYALVGAALTSILFHLFQYAYVYFQVSISHYGAIYGSFAAFPLFLLWLHISWMIVLYGAVLTYTLDSSP